MKGFRRARVAAILVGLAVVGAAAPGAHAGTVSMDRGAVVFTAEPGEANDLRANLLYYTWASDSPIPTASVAITDKGGPLLAIGDACTQVNENSVVCAEITASPSLLVEAGDGDDRVWVEGYTAWAPVTVRGGVGDDWLHAGSRVGFSPVLEGESGDDTLRVSNNSGGRPILRGGDGDDALSIPESGGGFMFGDDGDDRLLYSGEGVTELHGNAGDDHLIVWYFNWRRPPLLDGGEDDDRYSFSHSFYFSPEWIVPGPGIDALDQSDGTFPIDFSTTVCPGCVETVIGSPFDDRITGSDAAESIFGGDGADTLDGGGGSDQIAGQGGDDSIMSQDRFVDDISCDEGLDRAVTDGFDRPGKDCETIVRRPIKVDK